MQIIVDNSVLHHGKTHEAVSVTRTVKWPPGQESEVEQSYRVPIEPEIETNRQQDIERSRRYLPGIARAARNGKIRLWTTRALIYERILFPLSKFSGEWFEYNLFKKDDIGVLTNRSSLDRKRSNRVLFGLGAPPFKETERKENLQILREDPRGEILLKRLGEKKGNDIYHILEADEAGIDVFLTMDFNLLRSWRNDAKAGTDVRITVVLLNPKELGIKLGLTEEDPTAMEADEEDKAFASENMKKDLGIEAAVVIEKGKKKVVIR